MNLFNRLGQIIYSQVREVVIDRFGHKASTQGFYEENFTSEESNESRSTEEADQFKQDLELFDLVPPSSLEQIRKKRNQLLRKYHPDRYHGDFLKEKQAKEMIQIYNQAYERLVQNFSK